MESTVREIDGNLVKKGKVSHRDDLELVIMRWRYLLRTENPPEEVFEQFRPIIKNVVNSVWRKFRYVFKVLGYEREDLYSLAQVHLVSYIGLFSLRVPEKRERFRNTYKNKNGPDSEPSDFDYFKKDLSNFSLFLSQRLEEGAKIASNKNKYIRGTDGTVAAFRFENGYNEDIDDYALVKNPHFFGAKKLKRKEFKALKTQYGYMSGGFTIKDNGSIIRIVEIVPRHLTEKDVENSPIGYINKYNNTNPEEALIIKESVVDFDEIKAYFSSFDTQKQVELLDEFVEDFRGDTSRLDEIKFARKELDRLKREADT